MNVPNIPDKWDLALFILGFVALLSFKIDIVFILVGVFLMASGVILAARPYILELTLHHDANDYEVKEWIKQYFFACGILLLMVIFGLHVALYS